MPAVAKHFHAWLQVEETLDQVSLGVAAFRQVVCEEVEAVFVEDALGIELRNRHDSPRCRDMVVWSGVWPSGDLQSQKRP